MSIIRAIAAPLRSRSVAGAARVRVLSPIAGTEAGGQGMYAGQDFTPSGAGEIELYSFNFAPLLGAGETIVACSWTAAVDSGSGDGAIASRISGAATIIGTTVSQLAGPFLPGVTYRLYANATTSKGQSLTLWSRVYCPSL
jgi:hypothetical protein